MFTQIQKYLLLRYPIIWNTKLVPMVAIGLLFHLFFMGLGFVSGRINFSKSYDFPDYAIPIIFGVFAAVLITIIWLTQYFKNNSFKAMYQKSTFSLFYEWFQVFIIVLLLSSFFVSFSIVKQYRQRSYFTLEETQKRCKQIAQADIFINGSFYATEIDSVKSGFVNGERTNQDKPIVYFEDIYFNGHSYNAYSLYNREIASFEVITEPERKLNELEVKNWLYNNQHEKVQVFMNSYMKILKEHGLKTNITTDKWFQVTYKYPNFKDFISIKDSYYEESDYYNNTYTDNTETVYSEYYIQQNLLKNGYTTISNAHVDPLVDWEMIFVFLYVALGISLLILSFRVTSGKSWLIAWVIAGLLQIVNSIFAIVFSTGLSFMYSSVFYIIVIALYLTYIYLGKGTKSYSSIILVLFLNSFYWLIPLIYTIVSEHYSKLCNYQITNDPDCITHSWYNANVFPMFILNFFVSIVALGGIFVSIRKWKGIAEN